MSEEHNVAADPAQPAAAPEVVADAQATPPAQAPLTANNSPEAPVVTETPAAEPAAPETPTEAEPPAAEPTEASAEPEGMLKGSPREEGEKKPEDGAKPAETPQVSPVSEEIAEYKLDLPEGIELQAEPLQEFTNFAKEQKFSQETFQELVNFHVKAVEEVNRAAEQRQRDEFKKWTREWEAESMADPELGGAGFQTSLAQANWAITHFMPDGPLKERLNQDLRATGMAYNPGLFRLFVNFARFASEPAVAVAATNLPNPQTMPGASGAPRSGGRLSYKHPRGGQRGGSAA